MERDGGRDRTLEISRRDHAEDHERRSKRTREENYKYGGGQERSSEHYWRRAEISRSRSLSPEYERDGKRRRYSSGRLWIDYNNNSRRPSRLQYRDRERRDRERAPVPGAGKEKDNSNKEEAPTLEEKEGKEKARTYQLEVLAQAKEKNTIAFLETGAGKTLIAVLLMKEKYKLLREQGKRMLAVFLVPKVPLVYQVINFAAFKFYCNEVDKL